MRRLLAFVCFSALLALLVLGALPGSAAEQVTLRWTVWAGSPEELNIYQLQAKEFQEKNPGIKVILESGPFANYWDKQQAAFASNTAADVMELSHAFWPSLKTKGVLLDLLPIIRKTGYDLDGFYPQLLDNFYYKGGLYGFPLNASTCALTTTRRSSIRRASSRIRRGLGILSWRQPRNLRSTMHRAEWCSGARLSARARGLPCGIRSWCSCGKTALTC